VRVRCTSALAVSSICNLGETMPPMRLTERGKILKAFDWHAVTRSQVVYRFTMLEAPAGGRAKTHGRHSRQFGHETFIICE